MSDKPSAVHPRTAERMLEACRDLPRYGETLAEWAQEERRHRIVVITTCVTVLLAVVALVGFVWQPGHTWSLAIGLVLGCLGGPLALAWWWDE